MRANGAKILDRYSIQDTKVVLGIHTVPAKVQRARVLQVVLVERMVVQVGLGVDMALCIVE